ncbi:hypothetical protein BGZ76_006867 [Entomortierella beljakovae]|nr:hypothetical protein BGZ76_006867 [Entomortierella beljakovae]
MSDFPVAQPPESWVRLGEIPLPTPEKMIGKGGFGEVYLWDKDYALVAVKRIRVSDAYAKDIIRETDIVSRLTHKHIIQCLGVVRDANFVYIVTDYAEGGNLRDAVPRLDWENKKRIVAEIALGLAYLHGEGIIHRDIKGLNILLTKYDEVKLCDFGLAKVMASASCVTSYKPKGTPRWMAPELRRAKYSAQSDIFALGVVMHELIDGDTQNTPLDYIEVMKRCRAEDPEDRPTLKEIVDAFHTLPRVASVPPAVDDQIKIMDDTLAGEQYELGRKFFRGDGVDLNLAEAAENFRKAASRGHAMAQFRLSEMYECGDGVLRDDTKALEWLQKAVDQGLAFAQARLGELYRDGEGGVPQDYSKSFDLFQEAAYKGVPGACSDLGWMYTHGHGVECNLEEAITWYRHAVERGCPVGQVNLARFYMVGEGVEKNSEEAARLMSLAAAQGDKTAQFHLGNMYAYNEGVSQNSAEALKWWIRAAEGDHIEAQYDLGVRYMQGDGVRRNESKGFLWLKKAAEQGHTEAKYIYDTMRNDLVEK